MNKSAIRSALFLLGAGAFAVSQPALAQHHEDPAHKADDHHPAPADHDSHASGAEHKDDAHKAEEHKDDHVQHPQGH